MTRQPCSEREARLLALLMEAVKMLQDRIALCQCARDGRRDTAMARMVAAVKNEVAELERA